MKAWGPFPARLLHPTHPPTPPTQVLLASALDCVARLAPPGTVAAGSRLDRAAAYLSSNPALAGEPLYLHPTR